MFTSHHEMQNCIAIGRKEIIIFIFNVNKLFSFDFISCYAYSEWLFSFAFLSQSDAQHDKGSVNEAAKTCTSNTCTLLSIFAEYVF